MFILSGYNREVFFLFLAIALFMKVKKVDDTLFIPKLRTRHSNNPYYLKKVVLWMSPSLEWINYIQPRDQSLENIGSHLRNQMIYQLKENDAFLIVKLFRGRQLVIRWRIPSFLTKNNTEATYGELKAQISPFSRASLSFSWRESSSAGVNL